MPNSEPVQTTPPPGGANTSRVLLEKALVWLLPDSLARLIGFLYGVTVKKTSYSHYGEDLICLRYFGKKNISRGIYLDIGAFHPTWISNTHLLHKAGWSGFAVDIDRTKLQAIKLFRRTRVETVLAAIGPEGSGEESVDVYRFKRLWSEIDTLSLKTAQETRLRTGFDFEKSTVRVIGINSLMKRIGKIHFLNMDIEGLDDLVLRNMVFDEDAPELIVFEDNEHWGGSSAVKHILVGAGYIHLFTSGGSIGYCRPIP